MANIKDLTNQRFGRLIAIERTNQRKGNCFLWRCKCDCGNEVLVRTYFLTHKISQSCGCLQADSRKHDHTGKRFGRLVAIKSIYNQVDNCFIWRCKCDCGKIAYVRSSCLAQGITKSCGCLHDDTAKKNCKDIYKANLKDGTNIARIKSNKINANNTSGVKGVSWNKRRKKWIARIDFQKQTIELGSYDNLAEAAEARKKAEDKYFGEFLKILER